MSKNFSVRLVPGGELEATAVCEVTGSPYVVKVSYSGYKRWKSGALIQNALPELTDDQREFLMSGLTPAEWNKMVQDSETQDLL